jgi:chemotaxis protein methyltransferase CheR
MTTRRRCCLSIDMIQAYSEIAGLTGPQFTAISRLVKQRCGINLHQGKMALVAARLHKRLRALKFASFGQYLEHIRNDADGTETAAMLDALTTNVTHFFREPQHFHFLKSIVLPWILRQHDQDRRIRIWSAGCSSGEEPYSIAILLRSAVKNLGDWDLRVLATDLSQQMLKLARQGIYEPHQLRQVPLPLIHHNFTPCKSGLQISYRIKEPLKRVVDFAQLNLLDPWPMKGPFDAVFCRNVMIYFDKPTQQQLVERFWKILAPGGALFIGHSESLTGIRHHFSYQQPAVYQKCKVSEDRRLL